MEDVLSMSAYAFESFTRGINTYPNLLPIWRGEEGIMGGAIVPVR